MDYKPKCKRWNYEHLGKNMEESFYSPGVSKGFLDSV